MNPFVIVATKGRAKQTYILLNMLKLQSLTIKKIIIVGSESDDVMGLSVHPLFLAGNVEILISKAGITFQRNAGIMQVLSHTKAICKEDWFAVFFDDDFRPASDWISVAQQSFIKNPALIALTGKVIADGVSTTTHGLSELQSSQYLSGALDPQPHWTNVKNKISSIDLYGCNMAIRGNVLVTCKFDENLPLYGWQEDYDFSVRARKYGLIKFISGCVGVHLGVNVGRTSGLSFGYSQIANPTYLVKKGSMSLRKAYSLIWKNLASNVYNSLIFNRDRDYFGRLHGNLFAIFHFFTGSIDPNIILFFKKSKK